MKEVRQTLTINSSAKDAFDFAIDPENTPKWVDGVVKEVTNETPTRLGTVYKNQGKDGSWAEFEITDFEPGIMFEMTKKGDNTHVKYTFKPLINDRCELEYIVWVSEGELSERFSESNIQTILKKLKEVIEQPTDNRSSIEVKESHIAGKGIFATELIKKGATVLAWHPKVITHEEADKLPAEEKKHYLYPEGDKMLWMQPPERYINHSCDPNTHVVGQSDVASRDIEAGEEITSDYMDLETEDFLCRCGTSKCRNPA